MSKHFKPYNSEQLFLMPPSLDDWIGPDHLARFISEIVDRQLDLSSILGYYGKDDRGQPSYNPKMMTKVWLYAYCVGLLSVRRIERATKEDIAFRFLTANQFPDYSSFSKFRTRHLDALGGLFRQVLGLCQKAGIVKMGIVALDGTKMKANAAKEKSKKYSRILKTETELAEDIKRYFEECDRVEKEEDRLYGKDKRGDEMPEELRTKEGRLKKFREAKEALEREAKEQAEREQQEQTEKNEEREAKEKETGKKTPGRVSMAKQLLVEAKPADNARYNFTDPDSRMMSTRNGFQQAYNAQAVVDAHTQIIIASAVTRENNDKRLLIPMYLKACEETGKIPEVLLADTGYFSGVQFINPLLEQTMMLIPPESRRNGEKLKEITTKGKASFGFRMEKVLETDDAKKLYDQRKTIVEPVFGQIKDPRRIRGFSLRSLKKVAAEWDIICMTHNLLKLFRAGRSLAPA